MPGCYINETNNSEIYHSMGAYFAFFIHACLYIGHCYWPNGEKYSNHVIEIRGYGNRMNITCIDVYHTLRLTQQSHIHTQQQQRRLRPIEKLFGQRDWKNELRDRLRGERMKCKDSGSISTFVSAIYHIRTT